MIRVINMTRLDGSTKGWKVTRKKANREKSIMNYGIELDSADECRTKVAIDRTDYNDLTTPRGINMNSEAILKSINIGQDRYIPVIASPKDGELDQVIFLLNVELEVNDVFADVPFTTENMIVISHDLVTTEKGDRLTALIVSDDPHKPSKVVVTHGMKNGTRVVDRTIEFPEIIEEAATSVPVSPLFAEPSKVVTDSRPNGPKVIDANALLNRMNAPRSNTRPVRPSAQSTQAANTPLGTIAKPVYNTHTESRLVNKPLSGRYVRKSSFNKHYLAKVSINDK